MSIMNFKTYLEIPTFLMLFSISLTGPVLTNLIIFRTCYVNLGYNISDCALLGSENKDNNTQSLEAKVQPYANILAMVMELPVGIICAITALFFGCWSDRFGRKPVMVTTMTGHLISYGMVIIFSLLPNISSWYLTLSCLPIIFFGGFAATLTVFLSYLTDITDEESRGLRMGIFEVIISIGMLIGMISSSYVFNALGYIGIYTIALSSYIFAVLYTIFILEESLPNVETEGKLGALFQLQQVKDMYRTTFRNRPNNKRVIILLCISTASLFILAVFAGSNANYLFLRLKFGWTLKQYTFFTSARDVLSILGTFIGIYWWHKVLKVDESIVVLLGLISCMNGSLVQGLSSTNAHIYFGGAVRLLTGNVSPMLRSLMSKMAEPYEIGKIFSVLVMFENFVQMLGTPLFTYIYNNTLDSHPEFYNFVTAGILGVTIILITIVAVILQMSRNNQNTTIVSEDVSSTTVNEDENLIN